MSEQSLETHIKYIHESMVRIEKDMKTKHNDIKILIKDGLKTKAAKWTEAAMITFISLICVSVVGAIVSGVVHAFNG